MKNNAFNVHHLGDSSSWANSDQADSEPSETESNEPTSRHIVVLLVYDMEYST